MSTDNSQLPEKPSELIRAAIADLEAVEALPAQYRVNMGKWHIVRSGGQPCEVCLAGAVMARRLEPKASYRGFSVETCPSHFDSRTAQKLNWLDAIRNWPDAQPLWLNAGAPEGLEVPEEYQASPEAFKATMLANAAKWAEAESDSWVRVIERLEKCVGPDRELDAVIGRACGLTPQIKAIYRRGYYPKQKLRDEEIWPRFTFSLDAALTLVPEGWRIQLFEHPGKLWSARIIGPGFVTIAPFECEDNPLERLASSGAIALILACCKARRHLTPVSEQER